ncbi:hypothetical protein DMW99_22850 [Pseudomonas chlororaphis]|nr:hypothetical protein C1Y36_28320 [Pseudomonas sp. FW306-2-2C-D06C]PYC33280.1 hypothetical protein DMW99_22850 [Pseudomonas chlororaphis]
MICSDFYELKYTDLMDCLLSFRFRLPKSLVRNSFAEQLKRCAGGSGFWFDSFPDYESKQLRSALEGVVEGDIKSSKIAGGEGMMQAWPFRGIFLLYSSFDEFLESIKFSTLDLEPVEKRW